MGYENVRRPVNYADRRMLWELGIDERQLSGIEINEPKFERFWVPKDTLRYMRELPGAGEQMRFMRVYARHYDENFQRMTHRGFGRMLEQVLLCQGNRDPQLLIPVYEKMLDENGTSDRSLVSPLYIDNFINDFSPNLYRMIKHGEKVRAARAHR